MKSDFVTQYSMSYTEIIPSGIQKYNQAYQNLDLMAIDNAKILKVLHL